MDAVQPAARITAIAGGLLIGLAWVSAATGLISGHHAVTDLLAEAVSAVVVILAWRYRRHRLAAAALATAGAGFLVRTGQLPLADDAVAAALAVALAFNVVLLSATRDRPLHTAAGWAWFALIALQLWVAAVGVGFVGEELRSRPEIPVAIVSAAAAAVLVAALGFLIRRNAFEASLVWFGAGWSATFALRGDQHHVLLLLAAVATGLLIGVFEDAYRLAFHDELTGLPGRRALDESLRNLAGTYTIAMADIDHFKRFNDRHGHDAGDQVLRMVADELARVGGGGRAYRYGGEEFAIVFSGRAVAEVRQALEDLRKNIAERKFALRGPDRPKKRPEKPKRRTAAAKKVTVTVSIGAAAVTSRRSTPGAVIKAADRALYRAKRAGRNRVVAAGDRLPRK